MNWPEQLERLKRERWKILKNYEDHNITGKESIEFVDIYFSKN